jgi:hypothetical protein
MADPDSTSMHGPTVSLAEATDRCSVSRATIQRKLKAGEIVGATRTASGGWSIPITGLIAAGLMPRTTPPDQPGASVVADHAAENALLRIELAAARQLADERAERINDLRTALDAMGKALTAGVADTAPVNPSPSTETESVHRRPGGGWRRWRSRS